MVLLNLRCGFFNILKERVRIFDLSNVYCAVLTMENFYSEVLYGGGVGDSSNKNISTYW